MSDPARLTRGAFVASAAAACALPSFRAFAATDAGESPHAVFGAIENRVGGRLGVFAFDTGNGRSIAYRAAERFPMCSTFKSLAVAAVLARVDAGQERLARRVPYTHRDLLDYAPVTRAHAGQGWMTIEALCQAAIELSDNTAANLLLASLGGPHAVTRYARSLGDEVTRLDRTEPSLNEYKPGELRDTTSPEAMARDWERILVGEALSAHSRNLLRGWLIADKTGLDCIRAGVPKDWVAGDKTGSGENGTRNDVAILKPPGRTPIIVAAYLTGATAFSSARNAALAEVGRIAGLTF